MLENIRIVLVRTFHPGNIGSVARAMKTMGLKQLVLVNPKNYPADEANKMARTADDVLEAAVVVDSLFEAVKECSVVIASTARERGYDLPYLNPEESAEKLLQASTNGKVALVFGPERMGLSNDDLQHCKHRVTIPTHPDYSSLNIAAAVQTLSYEIYKNSLRFEKKPPEVHAPVAVVYPDIESTELFYTHLEDTLNGIEFINKKHPGKVMKKLRQLFDRAEMTEVELNIMRGILAGVDQNNKK